MTNPVKETKVITGKVRLSYTHVFEPESINGSDDKKYSVSLIIPKTDTVTINKIKSAVENAIANGLATKLGGKKMGLKLPLRDGDIDRADDEAYANSFFVNASCKTKPGIIDRFKNPITDPEELYSGCYGLASITFYAFNSNGSKGVACGLNNIMKVSEGEPLGGRNSADADFADVDSSILQEEDDEIFG
jgi:Protein of unknown function (DUF2815).